MKPSLFADGMIVYAENLKEPTHTHTHTPPRTINQVQQHHWIQDKHTHIDCISIY